MPLFLDIALTAKSVHSLPGKSSKCLMGSGAMEHMGELMLKLGLLDYGRNRSHNYFGQY